MMSFDSNIPGVYSSTSSKSNPGNSLKLDIYNMISEILKSYDLSSDGTGTNPTPETVVNLTNKITQNSDKINDLYNILSNVKDVAVFTGSLNTLTTNGKYIIKFNNEDAFLTVMGHSGYYSQTAHTISTGDIYFRVGSNAGEGFKWSTWKTYFEIDEAGIGVSQIMDDINNRPLNDTLNAITDAISALSVPSDVVNVMSFGAKGNGVSDDTKAFNDAINSLPNGGTVLVPFGKTYMIQGWAAGATFPDYPTGGIKLKSNITLDLTGVTLKVIPNNKQEYACLNITNCNNVKIIGGTLIGERDNHTPSPKYYDDGKGNRLEDQFGMGIAICGSSNVFIQGTVAKKFQGDGFCVGSNEGGTHSTNIHFNEVIADDNRRNGMSIIALVGGSIRNSVFKKANGMSPESGLDLEPNPSRIIENLLVIGNQFLDNFQHGILLASILTGVPSCQKCTFIGNTAKNNKMSGFYTNRAHYNTFIGNYSVNNGNNGFAFLQSSNNSIDGNYAMNNKYNGFMIGDKSNHNNIIGNYSIENSQETNGLYDQYVFFDVVENNIQHNQARHLNTSLTKKARYGMYLSTDCLNNLVTNNDLARSALNSGLNNASSSTSKGAGNRGNNGTTWSTGDFI